MPQTGEAAVSAHPKQTCALVYHGNARSMLCPDRLAPPADTRAIAGSLPNVIVLLIRRSSVVFCVTARLGTMLFCVKIVTMATCIELHKPRQDRHMDRRDSRPAFSMKLGMAMQPI
jgi:hypothetical protein